MAFANIDYGAGRAEIFGDFAESEAVRFFMRHANQCFGIRKSIMKTELLAFNADAQIPKPWNAMSGAAAMLRHTGGDTIVWGSDGEKIKTEWD